MKHIIFTLIYLASATLIYSCKSQEELSKLRKERAKQKINKIIDRYPDLASYQIDTVIRYDTIINNKIITEVDTIILPAVLDTISILDTTKRIDTFYLNNKTDYVIINKDNKTVTVNLKPKTYYIHDTIRFSDTIVNTVEHIKIQKVVDTTKDFWFNLWLSIKSWIWWILIILGILLIVRLVLNKVKNKLL
jgi:hypothetical protein